MLFILTKPQHLRKTTETHTSHATLFGVWSIWNRIVVCAIVDADEVDDIDVTAQQLASSM